MSIKKVKTGSTQPKEVKTDAETQAKYELMIIVRPILGDDDRASVQDDLIKNLKKFGGEVLETDVWGKRHLAYKIDNHGEGYYIVYKVSLPKASVEEINNFLKYNKDVIRHLLIDEKNL